MADLEPEQFADTVRPDPPDWRCRCGETNPPEFGTCWLCGAFEEER